MCEHKAQSFIQDKWVCQKCGKPVPRKRKTGKELREAVSSVRLNGMENLKQMRDLGTTEREMTKKNLEMYKKNNPDKDPVRVDGKDRWI